MADEDQQLASRVARIESHVAHIDSSVANIQVDFRELRKEMGEGFKAVNARIDVFYTGLEGKIEGVRAGLEGKIESVRTELDGKIAGLRHETNGGFKSVNGRIDALDAKGTKHFLWLLSTMIALALAVGGALLKGLLAQ